MDILHTIVERKRQEVDERKAQLPLSDLIARITPRTPVSFRASLEASDSGIISEFKRKSPSKGWIHPDAKVVDVVPFYEKGGASACSILTDHDFFGGSESDLREARSLVSLPLLRKDFIIDEYQIYEAREMGADIILLIAAILTPEQCAAFAAKAHELGLETLLEVHDTTELTHLNDNIDVLGVNNRNLGTFHTDLGNSHRMVEAMSKAASSMRKAPLIISESGISDPATIREFRKLGFRGFLIGETFMKTGDPGTTLRDFIRQIKEK